MIRRTIVDDAQEGGARLEPKEARLYQRSRVRPRPKLTKARSRQRFRPARGCSQRVLLIGWVAATNQIGIEAITLFLMQFFWQFPHFWAIGWFLFEDYEKGGFFMLPTGKRDKSSAIQIIMYTIWTIILSVIPAFGLTGSLILSIPAAILVFLLGVVMLYFAVLLYKKQSIKAARQLMLVSVSYITLLQIIFVVDKFSG